MILNYIWIAFFLIALVVAILKTFAGNFEVFGDIVAATFDISDVAVDLSIGLTGVLCLWMGLMKIGEKGGSIQFMSKAINPFFSKLFPDIPEDHPARGSMLLNFAANMLGLDNAATPAGLKAMNELQELNSQKDTASNAQIMFLVLNTSGLTLIPITVMTYRNTAMSANPSEVFLPILISTFVASIIGLIAVSIYQKINIFNKVVLGYLGGITLLIGGMVAYFNNLEPDALKEQSALLSNVILYGIICTFIIMALFKKVNVYDAFIEGAKGGFEIAIKIIPFLVAILVSIAVFKASGAMGYMVDAMRWFFALFFENTDFVDGIPTAIMKPLSGSGARGMMLSSWDEFGVDSFVGKLTATLQGATDTTFYIVAVYFGSVGIKNTRYAIKLGLLADLAGIVAAILVSYMFYSDTTVTQATKTEITTTYVTCLSEHNPESIIQYLDDAVCLYDQSYDTIAYDKTEILEYISSYPNNLETIKISEVADVIYLKTMENKTIKPYKITFEKGKIVSLQLMGDY